MKPIDETTITLRCPKCAREKVVDRLPHDYLGAVRMENECPECWGGDFVETKYFDSAGVHLTSDPREG